MGIAIPAATAQRRIGLGGRVDKDAGMVILCDRTVVRHGGIVA